MKSLRIASVCLLFAAEAASACSVVYVVETQPSSQNARITVLIDGKPQKDVKLALSTLQGQPRLTIATDSRGTVRLPDLPPGEYCIVASASPNLRADLCLAVSKHRSQKHSSFSMNLGIVLPPPTLEDKLEAAEKTSAKIRTQVFSGIVQDPAGAAIPHARVDIHPYGASRKTPLRTILTDEQGRFSDILDPGAYTAAFQVMGFQTQIVSFDIAEEAEKEILLVKLKIASCP